jgi:hypothetical protein
MEQLIEFPLTPYYITSSPLIVPAGTYGYCICYQYDVNEHGYGPYGFRTNLAKNLLSQAFGPLSYWDDTRKKMLDTEVPDGCGLYFFKGQSRVKKLEEEVLNHQRAGALQTLRKKYGKSASTEPTTNQPLLYHTYEDEKIRATVIERLLNSGYEFFFTYRDLNLGGETLVFFSPLARKKIKDHSKRNNINYIALSSADELKDW